MFRFSVKKCSKVGMMVVLKKQSQKLFLSSTSDIPSTSLLKARHDMDIACMNERLDLEIKKFDAEIQKYKCDLEIKYSLEKQNIHLKYFDGQLNPQLRNANNEQNTNAKVIEIENDTAPKESLPTGSNPSLFKNDHDINYFCENIKSRVITPEVAQKIVYVLRNCSGDEKRVCCILSTIHTELCLYNNSHIRQILSAAGFGNALSVVLSVQSTNSNTLKHILDVFIIDNCCFLEWKKCVQDLYDAIDSPDGYDGAIFDALLENFKAEDVLCHGKTASIAVCLIDKTKSAKQFMIEKDYLSVLAALPDNIDGIKDLKQRLNQE